jgi:predicted dehydrogenase
LVRAAKATGDIKILAGVTGRRALAEDFAAEQGFRLVDRLDQLLVDPAIETVILATPHLDHEAHIVAAAEAGKHIFVEKPFTMTKASAERAVAAIRKAGVVVGLGHNRRFHPNMIELRRRVKSGEVGTILHVEGTLTAPGGLFLKPDNWRVDPRQSPAGGMAALGIHLVDGMIDVVGSIREVTCQSLHRASPTGIEDTTSILLAFNDGPTGYVACLNATTPSFRFCVYGSKGIAEVRGMALDQFSFAPVPDAPLSGPSTPKSVETAQVTDFNTVAAELSAFAAAVRGTAAYPITLDQMIHGAAVFEAVATSAATGTRVTVG